MSFNKKIETKGFYNIELVNIAEWYAQSRQEDKEKFNVLPFRIQLALRTNMQEVNKTAQSLIEIRNELVQSLGNKYIEAGKTEEVLLSETERVIQTDQTLSQLIGMVIHGRQVQLRQQVALKVRTLMVLQLINQYRVMQNLQIRLLLLKILVILIVLLLHYQQHRVNH